MLPKSWCVNSGESTANFKETVISYMNGIRGRAFFNGNSVNNYYGKDENGNFECMSKPFATVLTLEEFKQLINEDKTPVQPLFPIY